MLYNYILESEGEGKIHVHFVYVYENNIHNYLYRYNHMLLNAIIIPKLNQKAY